MSSQVETDARREQIAIIIADPYQKLPLAKDLAAQYSCSVRTIYNDIESPDVQARVQNLIRLHAKSTGIAAAYRVILDCIAGGKGWTKGQQLSAAQWIQERTALFGDLKIVLELNSPADRTDEYLKAEINKILNPIAGGNGNGNGNGEGHHE